MALNEETIIFNEKNIGNVELATTAFGQGVSVTPIQQVTAVSAVVNGVLIIVTTTVITFVLPGKTVKLAGLAETVK